ncbi:MAG: SCO family protein [Nitrospirae bacterium]|nr:SCO family protein [Nitrospirota bacterium]
MSSATKRLIAVLLAGIIIYACASGRKAPDFNLNIWDGEPVTQEGLKGRTVVLVFSYAYCSLRCPVVTARLFALDEAMETPKDVVYFHISVDPDNDTPERMKKYFSLYRLDAEKDRRWMFVSGAKDELLKIWKFYGVTSKRIEDKNIPEGYYIEYSPKMVIIDKKGIIRHETDYNFSEKDIIKKIKGLS